MGSRYQDKVSSPVTKQSWRCFGIQHRKHMKEGRERGN